MPLDPYEQCLAFYRRWCADWHMTPNEIDETDLELMLDMEVLDSKIDAAFNEKTAREASRMKVSNKKTSSPKHIPFSGNVAFIDQIMNF